jgi:hypothetical protein
MAVIAGKGLTQNDDNCFIHTTVDANNVTRPFALVGEIVRQDTGGRDSPPDCVSGFKTDGTPFAKGHIMALELGGPDITSNIVPQYGQWQGNPQGEWRKMETAINDAKATDEQVMVVLIDYDDNAADNYDGQLQNFSGGNKLFHWVDRRIPTRFRVWALKSTWTTGTAPNVISLANYFAADSTGKAAAINPLTTALSANTGPKPKFDQTINAMPSVDREYWKKQMVFADAEAQFLIYEAAQKARISAFDTALTAAGGPIRNNRRITRGARNNSPLGKAPADPLDFAKWIQVDANLEALAIRIQNNANNAAGVGCAVGWTAVEMQSFTKNAVTTAIVNRRT